MDDDVTIKVSAEDARRVQHGVEGSLDREITITVSAESAKRIQDLLDSGEYASASEVVRAALRRLDEDDYETRMAAIRARVRASLDDRRPDLTGDQVREHLQRLHEETMRRGPAEE